MANSGRFPHKVGSYVDAEYTITITIENVYYNGSEIQSLVTIANREGNPIFEKSMFSNKGHFGSVANLMGDSIASLGERIGDKFRWLAKQ